MAVDDDPTVLSVIDEVLSRDGVEVVTSPNAEAALAQMEDVMPDLVITDVRMPRKDGIALLREVRKRDPHVPFILLTAYASVSRAVEAMKAGAYDFLKKPFRLDDLRRVVRDALEGQMLRKEVLRLKADQCENMGDVGCTLVGGSDAMKQVYRTLRKVAASPATTVLITGESGTGKELIARATHYLSTRRDRPFVEINCAALTETLLEAELFGYERGAFTGAVTTGKRGLFEAADGGTVFLDEIGEMGTALQARLLRVLQEKRFKRVGGVEDVNVDVRIVASTNRDLEKMVAEGQFRPDLYFRLRVIPIHLPPLRDRKEDILPLAKYFLDMFNSEFSLNVRGFTSRAEQVLTRHFWPGNVRELRNVIERAVVLHAPQSHEHGKGLIDPALLDCETSVVLSGCQVSFDMREMSIAHLEKQLISKVLDQTKGHRTEAARILGINRTTLYNKIKEYDLAVAPRSADVPCRQHGRDVHTPMIGPLGAASAALRG